MNLVFIATYIKKLYNLIIDELLYDSDITRLNEESNTDNEFSDYSSEDNIYINLLIQKNDLEISLYGKDNLCFIIMDEYYNTYGMYYPGLINGNENFSPNVSFFILSKGIEVYQKRYDSNNFFTNIKFSNDYLIKVGENHWLFKLYKDHIIFNFNQNLLNNYNTDIMKDSKILKILVFKCKFN